MTSCKGNVVEEMLESISRCSEHQAALRQHAPDAEALRERAMDMLQDVEQRLCNLAVSFITAPMSGRSRRCRTSTRARRSVWRASTRRCADGVVVAWVGGLMISGF